MSATVPQVAFNRNAVRPVECVKGGWNLIKNQYWLIFGMCFVGWMIASAVGLLIGSMMCGLFWTFFAMRRRQPVEFGMLFKGFDYILQSIIAALIHSVPVIIIIVPAYILFYVFFLVAMVAQGNREPNPVVWLTIMLVYALFWLVVIAVIMFVSIGFIFVYPLLVDRKLSALDAIKLSFKAAMANFFGLLGLIALNFIMSVGGLLLCFVGIYFVVPISYSAIAVAYEQVFGLSDGLSAPNVPPPPPVFT